uniref:mannosyl-oligosaccharide 1,3-1,6-alpha-mannosidase n=1 Tax=Steinernema glaseri TaxID=37863 RepID=A0A1I7XVX0_9BILA
FTSRPFYKRLDRTLQHYLRSAELLFTFAKKRFSVELSDKLFSGLVTARRALSIFQHHDGVTGTAKDPVVLDYGNKMQDALVKCWKIIESATEALLSSGESDKEGEGAALVV